MGQISLNREDAMRVLNTLKASPDARIIAACTIAFFEAREHSEDVDSATRSIALKLCHMVGAEIYAAADG